jgi:hypothetical protein
VRDARCSNPEWVEDVDFLSERRPTCGGDVGKLAFGIERQNAPLIKKEVIDKGDRLARAITGNG